MIQFPDYVHAIHEDRRRTFEAEAANRAAISTKARSSRRSIRRRRRRPRFRVNRSHEWVRLTG